MKKIMVAVVLVLLVWGVFWANNKWLQTTEYTVVSEELPEAFNGKKIVQISDLHNTTFGKNQATLIEKVKQEEPDAVFLTGDFIDSNRFDLSASLAFIDAIVETTDVYYVTGNHEIASNRVEEIADTLTKRGVVVLADDSTEWEEDGETVQIVGIHDPLNEPELHEEDAIRDSFSRTQLSRDFTLLLVHRPEYFPLYAEAKIDLVFAGHAHGGQVRIPGIGGVYSPGQGWFPQVTEGVFEKDQSQMVVSRGLGNSTFPLRILNRPEVVVVTLKKQE